jgi:hypothetical protein
MKAIRRAPWVSVQYDVSVYESDVTLHFISQWHVSQSSICVAVGASISTTPLSPCVSLGVAQVVELVVALHSVTI